MIARSLVILVTVLLVAMWIVGCTPPASQGHNQQGPLAPPAETPETELKLTIIEPADDSVVSNSVILLKGKTIAGAVVSVNGEVTSADSMGNFSVTVILEEGPNVIEVTASDEYGNEARATLMVVLMKGE